MLAHEFMRNALIAGSLVGLACGVAGWLLVLRAQVFAGDALGHVAFTGALIAAFAGADVRLGVFAATVLTALALGGLGDRLRAADDVTIGTLFAWSLGLGVLFLSLFTTRSSAGNGTAGVRVLFGSILGLSAHDVEVSAAIAAVALAGLVTISRPLLYASLDGAVAAAQGVRVRLLGVVFLGLVGLVAAEATQAVGALLLLGLLAAPAGAAHRLTSSPYRGIALSACFALASVWIGLAIAYRFPSVPPSTAVISTATALYAAASLRPLRRA